MVNLQNLCIFEGRLTKAPTFSQVQMGQNQDGSPNMVDKAMFTIAADRALSSAQRQQVKNGNTNIKTADFITFTLIGGQVETLKNYFPQGKAIRILSHFTEYQTTDQNGQTKYGYMFEADHIGFVTQDAKALQGNNGGQQNTQSQGGGGYQQPQQHQSTPQPQPQGSFSMFDEENQPF